MLNRNHQWIWIAGTDHLLYSVGELVERYYLSVGRNTNLLIGMVINDKGLVPEADVRQFTVFGGEIRRQFSQKNKRNRWSRRYFNLARWITNSNQSCYYYEKYS